MIAASSTASSVFTTAGVRRGALGIMPIIPAVAAFALVYGIAAADKGMTLLEVGLSCAFIFAGASQLVAMDLWREPLPVVTMIVSVLIINLRHVLMGATVAPWFERLNRWQTFGSLYFMTDESWGVAVADRRLGHRDAAYMAGAGATLWLFFIGFSMGGHALGQLARGLDPTLFAWLTTAFFIVLLASFWRGAGDLLPWLLAFAVAIATKLTLGGTWHILAGALAGSLLGAWRHVRRP